MTADVLDVAACIIDVSEQGNIDPLKLQKLLYYVQAWYLAWYGEPLFADDLEAWPKGPCVYRVYKAYQIIGGSPITKPVEGDPSAVSGREREAIKVIVAAYGAMSGNALIRLTHSERPWLHSREGLGPDDYSNTPISKDSMRDFYRHEGTLGGAATPRPGLTDQDPASVDALRELLERELGVSVESVESS